MLDNVDTGLPYGHPLVPFERCASLPKNPTLFSGKSPGWGGARPNSGGPRPNSGGARPGAGRPRKGVPPIVSVIRWYCLRTDHNAERLAHQELSAANFEVFAPTIWKPAEEMRRYTNGSVRRARPARVVPMFRRYVFVRLSLADPAWHRIVRMPGVANWIASVSVAPGLPAIPIAVRDEAIDHVREMLVNDCLYPPRHFDLAGVLLPLIEAGKRLRVLDGALADREAFCRASDGKRVEMMMRWFNRDTVVRTRQAGVEEAC